MPELDQQFGSPVDRPTVLKCKVTRAPADVDSTCSVQTTDDGLDHDKVRFMPRGEDLPARGDKGVAVIDEQGDAWLAVWYPS